MVPTTSNVPKLSNRFLHPRMPAHPFDLRLALLLLIPMVSHLLNHHLRIVLLFVVIAITVAFTNAAQCPTITTTAIMTATTLIVPAATSRDLLQS